MRDEDKSREQLLDELRSLRRQLNQPEQKTTEKYSGSEGIEKALEDCKQQLQIIFDSSPAIMMLLNEKTEVIMMNQTGLMMAGKSGGEVVGLRGGDILRCVGSFQDPKGCGFGRDCRFCKVRNTVEKTFENGRNYHKVEASIDLEFEGRAVRHYVQISTAIVSTDRPRIVLVTIDDITQLKEIEHELKISQGAFQQFFDNVPEVVLLQNISDRKIIYISRSYESVFGQPLESAMNNPSVFVEALHPDDRERLLGIVREHTGSGASGKGYHTEYRVIHPDGSLRWINSQGFPIRDHSGQPYRLAVVARDITERKRAEEELRLSERKYRQLVEGSPDIIYSFSINNGVLYCSKQVEAILGYSPEYLYSKPWLWHESIHPEDQSDVFEVIHHFSQDDCFDIEYRIKDSTGSWRWFRDRSIGKQTEENDTVIEGIATDITIQKQAQKQLKASLEEKEVLLHEIHHRVKNNLTIVSSLLNLQARRTDDDTVRTILKDSQSRVQAMSVIHETLYRSENLSSIDMKDYLSRLVKNIFQSFGHLNSRVSYTIEADSVKIGVKKATPIGLVVNELVTNALKYAFPQDSQGQISIRLSPVSNDRMELIVSDDGIGLPGDFNLPESDSLGLKLVNLSIKNQLEGSIQSESSNGTRYRVTFNANDD